MPLVPPSDTHAHAHAQQAASKRTRSLLRAAAHAFSRPAETPPDTPLRREAEEDAGEREEGVEGGGAGEAERRAAAAVEEEAVRPGGGRRPAAAAQTAAQRGGRHQSQGAELRQHEDGGLRGAQGPVRVLHGGHDGRQGDRLQVPAGRGLERGDHPADGPVQEPPGGAGRQVHPPEAAAAGGTQDRPDLLRPGVTRTDSPPTLEHHQRFIGRRSQALHVKNSSCPPPFHTEAYPPGLHDPRLLSIQTLLSQETKNMT